jgi:C4-dicarboxylate-specific signal transduction histidine kinase
MLGGINLSEESKKKLLQWIPIMILSVLTGVLVPALTSSAAVNARQDQRLDSIETDLDRYVNKIDTILDKIEGIPSMARDIQWIKERVFNRSE